MRRVAGIGLSVAAALVAVVPAGCVDRRSTEQDPDGSGGRSAGPARVLTVYCAAGIRPPMVRIAEAFQADHPGVQVRMEYDGSGKLLGRLVTAKAPEYRPDVFVAGDEFYGRRAQEQGLVDRIETMAFFRPVIAVPKDNPNSIETLSDLAADGLRVALGDSRATAVGVATDALLEKADLMAVRRNSRVGGSTVQELANALLMGHADAAIIWDATTYQGDFAGKFKVIAIPQADDVPIVICRVTGAKAAELADEFIEMAAGSEAARRAFREHHYTVRAPAPGSEP